MRRLLVLLKNIISIPSRLFNRISLLAILQDDEIDKTAAICSGVKFYRGKIGRYSYIGNNSFVIDTEIGNYTSIAPDCYIGGTNHPMDWVSTSPVFHKWENLMKKNFSNHEFEIFNNTIVGNDVWIGNKVMIKAGITISDGAVVGMGSIVTRDIGPYEIWAGNPAKMIRKRFDDDVIEKLMEIKWWEWSEEKLEVHASDFDSPRTFIESLEEYR